MPRAAEVEAHLRRHVLAPWYPRAVDRARGGFHQTYGEDWSRRPDETRSLVYQSRLTWVAAQSALRYPKESGAWRARARHGLDYLSGGPLHDRDGGAWFWAVGAGSGKPENTDRGTEKHAYGIAFGIYACAAAYAATRDPRALATARDAFRWLDVRAHDPKHGGYYEALSREGEPLLAPPRPDTRDAIGTAYGLKSMNTHIHLLEAFTALHAVWPDRTLRSRLREVFAVVRDRVAAPAGYLHLYLKPDWTPVPDHDSFGHDVETAFLLVEASAALGRPDDAKTWAVVRRLVDHALHHGWDRTHGGFYDAGVPGGRVTNDRKVWWTQAEGLNALLLMHERYGRETPRYGEAFRRQWGFIARHQTDARHGGWLSDVSASGGPVAGQIKSDAWKDPYHQGRALLNVSAALRGGKAHG